MWLLRLPDERDEADSPWRRAEQARLLPNPDLPDTRWNRREARLGWSGDWPLEGQGRLWLRAWQVRFSDQPAERPLDDGSGDHGWRSVDRLQNGLQLHASGTFQRHWSLHLSQAWLPESDEPLSREYPTYLADGSLGWQRRYFSRELELRLLLGLHHEYGAVDALGDPLWERPELWLMAHAQRGRFTLWWSVRNLLGARNARVEGRTLYGYEEILGVRWDFHD